MSPCDITTTRMVVSSQATAITCTVARLLYRWHTRRFWWEDTCAMIAAAWTCICTAGFLLYDTSRSPTSLRNQISAWFMALSFTAVLWTARLSIFLSLVRISNPTGSSRHIALACIGSFLVMFVASMTQKIYYCGTNDCFITLPIGIMQLITDVIADSALWLGPIPLLRGVRLSRNRRILIISAFSSSLLISGISIAHSILIIYEPSILTVILGAMKAATSLFICNILVLVTFAYRVCKRCGGDGDLNASFVQTGPLYLTTVDLSQLATGTTCSDVSGVNVDDSPCTNTDPNMDADARQKALLYCSLSNVCSDKGSGDVVKRSSMQRDDEVCNRYLNQNYVHERCECWYRQQQCSCPRTWHPPGIEAPGTAGQLAY